MLITDGPKYEMHITCDAGRCGAFLRVFRDTREECNKAIYEAGWCLYRKRTLCPRHTQIVLRSKVFEVRRR
jgi:hypothetical protein